MSPQSPVGKCSVNLEGLGRLEGWQYSNGVRQFTGIPYATLTKRWTRSYLNTSWNNHYHDGTKLGNDCPNPETEGDDFDDLVPVPPFAHFNRPLVDELSALVMNIVLPPAGSVTMAPISAYVHGGSLLYGGANLAIFDSVNLVSHSLNLGKPIVAINFNYRVGLGGFLAGAAIQEELATDGFSGSGNFGLTDQQVAFEWIHRYASQLGGNIDNVTAVGESAGAISISHQLIARRPAKFHKAICMSGLAFSIPAWTREQHNVYFEAVCRHFSLNPMQPGVLDRLRAIPQQELANATSVIQGVASGTGNPCIDGDFYAQNPLDIHPAPSWLESYMIGDVYHEGVIFHLNVMDDDYAFLRSTLLKHIKDEATTDTILELYGLNPTLSQEQLTHRFEHMCGDAIFKIPNYLTGRCNTRLQRQGKLFLYHFDQRSRLQNALYDTAYHAHELLYLFANLPEKMSTEEIQMSHDFGRAWIDFAYGDDPWDLDGGDTWQWKIWGPKSIQAVRTEAEDEDVRMYSRFEKMLALGEPSGEVWKKWVMGIDDICNKRMRMGKAVT